VTVGEINEAHTHHQNQQVPDIANVTDFPATFCRLQNLPQTIDHWCFGEQVRVPSKNPPLVEVLPHQQVDELGFAGKEVKVPGHHLANDIGGCRCGRQRLHLDLLHPLIDRLEHGGVEALLVSEIVIEHPLVAVGRRHNRVDRNAVKTTFGKEFNTGRKQPPLGASRIAGTPGDRL